MKANSRRRVLISSIAMLLVALVALSTATFAWFTQNTTATADGVYAKTVKASSLLISKANKTWRTSVTYTQGSSTTAQTMFPASSGTGSSWFTATSTNETTGAVASGTISSVSPAGSSAKYVYKEMLNIKNAGDEGTITDITIEMNLGSIEAAEYARVALVPCSDTGVDLSTPAFEGQKVGFANCVYDTEGDSYGGLTATSGTTAAITATAAEPIEVKDLAAGEAVYYNLYVWFEGQDEDCIDTNAGQTINGLSFTVSGEPA